MPCLDQPGPVYHCHSLGALTGEIDMVSRSRPEAPNGWQLGRTPEFQDLKASDADTVYEDSKSENYPVSVPSIAHCKADERGTLTGEHAGCAVCWMLAPGHSLARVPPIGPGSGTAGNFGSSGFGVPRVFHRRCVAVPFRFYGGRGGFLLTSRNLSSPLTMMICKGRETLLI